MKKTGMKMAAWMVAAVLMAPAALMAQEEKDKVIKEEKLKEKKDVQQIVITRKNNNGEKLVVEVNGDKITVNGKPLEELKNQDADISVKLHKLKDMETLARIPGMSGAWSFNGNDNFSRIFSENSNQAMLGVTTDNNELGAAVTDITKESAAEKVGLKEGDIITKVDDKKISSPDDLSKAIKSHKPGDKVTITYLRDKKEQTATAELTKWKGMQLFESTAPFKMDLGGIDFDKSIPRALTIPRTPAPGQNWSWSGGAPKLGLSVQDTDNGKGVKVIEVDEESNAKKAGIKEEDVITEVDGKAVNSTDDMVKMIRESKEKTSIMVKLQRSGKTQNIEVKMPRKIKTADL